MFSARSKQNLEFLTIQSYVMKILGVDINTLQRQELIKNYRKLIFLTACVVYVQLGLIYFVVYSGITNLHVTSGSLSIFNQGCLVLLKLATFLTRGDKFMKLVWDINLLAEKATDVENKKWVKENSMAQLIGKMYFYTCWLVVSFSGFFPLVLMAFDYNKGNGFNRKLPFGGKFPCEDGGVLFFIINYSLSLLYIYAMLHMTVGVDGLYVWYIHSISAHFRMLRSKIEKVGLHLQNDSCTNFTQAIGSIVCYHNRTLGFVQDLNAIYGGILWAEVMLSSLQMCFAIFTLNNDHNVFNMPLNLIVLIAGFMQMSIYCLGGEKINMESFMLSLDFYLHVPWHKMSVQQQKLMLLPLMRSQKLSTLRGLFFQIDRNLLVYILKTAFSFNTLLSAMKE